MKWDTIGGQRVACYDNGGVSADRYAVLFREWTGARPGLYGGFFASAAPYHPQGVGMHGEARPGRHLGRRISPEALPPDVRRLADDDAAVVASPA